MNAVLKQQIARSPKQGLKPNAEVTFASECGRPRPQQLGRSAGAQAFPRLGWSGVPAAEDGRTPTARWTSEFGFKAESDAERNAGRRLGATSVSGFKRSMADVLSPLDAIAADSPSLLTNREARFQYGGGALHLPRYTFIGPRGGDEPVRIGLFAGIHGDEPEGVFALVQLLRLLETKPELAAGYCLFVYPVCNPTGFEDGTRHSRAGKDLNREFWTGSREPEVRFLEAELTAHGFHGVISLHTDDSSDGFYGYAHGATLTENLIEPALAAAEQFLPRNRNGVIDGFKASGGVIRDGYRGVLSAPPEASPRPFEIILETPKRSPEALKEAAFVAALQSILTNYRELIAYAPNL